MNTIKSEFRLGDLGLDQAPMAYALNPAKGKDFLYVHIVGEEAQRAKSEILRIIEKCKETDSLEIQWRDDTISDLFEYFGESLKLPKLDKTI